MKQVLGKSDGVLVARMPVPSMGPREVLVRVRYSLISTGTETAAMKLPATPVNDGGEKKSVLYARRECTPPPIAQWALEAGTTTDQTGTSRVVTTGDASYAYAMSSPLMTFAAEGRHVVTVRVRLLTGNLSCGLLSADGSSWLAMQSFPYPMPELAFNLYIDVPAGPDLQARLVISNNRPGVTHGSRFEPLGVSHSAWIASRGELPEPSDQSTEEQDASSGLKGVVKQFVQKWSGERDSRTERWLREWYRYLTGKPGATMPRLIPAEGLPTNEMEHQGWALGYSCAGEVVATGDQVKEFAVGDRVACAGAGLANHAELVAVPVNLVAKLPDAVDFRAGASATVGAIAMQGVRRAEVTLGDRVIVIGLGLIGQLTGQLCKAAGCSVIGFDPAGDRVQRALGHAIDEGAMSDSELLKIVRRLTGGHGADAVIITAATKSDAPINLAMKVARRRGRVVISGDVDIHPERRDFYQKEIDLRMATSYGPGRYDASYETEGRDYPLAYARWTANRNMSSYLDLIAQGKVDFLGLVEAEFTLNDAPAAYQRLLGTAAKPMAVLLSYPDVDGGIAEITTASRTTQLTGGVPARQGVANFVLVGAGAFGQSMLVPKMMAHPDKFQFYGVVSRHGSQGSNFARSLGVSRMASELTPFLQDTQAHILVIATRHHEHAEQAITGLRAGKHVFVEKPLAINWQQLQGFVEAYEALPVKPHLLVGFNRRFSPAVSRLRESLQGRRGPLMMNYRMNAGYVPLDSWLQGEHGGGRNIGEACHMYDVFRSLTGAPVESVHAVPIGQRPADRLASDNFIATMRYADGSIATLTYSAMGPREGLPKERFEVFCDGQAFVVDDYVRLIKAGETAPLWEGTVDKGHAEELAQFGQAIAEGTPSPIPIEEILETTALALKIEESLR